MRSDKKEKDARPGKKTGFLQKLRGLPFDWVSLVMFVCVLTAATLLFLPLNKGGASIGEAIGGKGTVFEPDKNIEGTPIKLSRDMATIVSDETSPLYEHYMDGDRVNILLVGLNDNMSDVIMLASYDMESQKIDIISIPRDTYFYRGPQWKNYAFHKINSVYHSEGIVPLAEYVSSLLYGVPVNYYMIVDYDAVVKITEAIGGVKMNIPFHMKYDDTTKGKELHIDIPAGEQTIDGTNVMQFLRFRHTNPSYEAQGYHSYPGGDIQRVETHQAFLKAVIKECVKAKNIKKVMNVAMECVKSDLTYNAAVSIAAKALEGLKEDSANTFLLPGYDKTLHELSFWVPDEEKVLEMLKSIFDPESVKKDAGNAGNENAEGKNAAGTDKKGGANGN